MPRENAKGKVIFESENGLRFKSTFFEVDVAVAYMRIPRSLGDINTHMYFASFQI